MKLKERLTTILEEIWELTLIEGLASKIFPVAKKNDTHGLAKPEYCNSVHKTMDGISS